MRFAVIVAFIGSVLFHVDLAEARSGGAPSAAARETPKAKKRHAKATKAKARAKKTKKGAKRAVKAPVETEDEDDVVKTEAETPAPPREVAPARSHGPAVAQASDDEEPGPAPTKRRW